VRWVTLAMLWLGGRSKSVLVTRGKKLVRARLKLVYR
jgi:hypothetical protein